MERNWDKIWDGAMSCLACRSTIIDLKAHEKVCPGERPKWGSSPGMDSLKDIIESNRIAALMKKAQGVL